MKRPQVSSIPDVGWSKANISNSFYRLSNTWASHNNRVQDLLLPSIKAELSCKIGGTDQHREVETTEACPIVEDESYILELEQVVQSDKSMVNSLPNMRAPHSSQLQVERDEPFDFSLKEPITDEPGSITAQIVAEIVRGTNTDEEANADMEEDSPAEDSPAESISD